MGTVTLPPFERGTAHVYVLSDGCPITDVRKQNVLVVTGSLAKVHGEPFPDGRLTAGWEAGFNV